MNVEREIKTLQRQVGTLAVVQCFLLIFLLIVMLTNYNISHAWEGDDGGLDQWEVQVGRYADRMNNQMQLTTPPAPPPPPVPVFSSDYRNGTCVGAIPLLQFYSPGWDATYMAQIMYRESRCQPGADNGICCHGLLQIHESWFRQLGNNVGPVNIYDPAYNVRAAAYVWRHQGYGAWSTA